MPKMPTGMRKNAKGGYEYRFTLDGRRYSVYGKSVRECQDTFATRAVESGMQAKTLQEILGHADIGITMNLYAHVMEDTKRRQMAAVEVMPGQAR